MGDQYHEWNRIISNIYAQGKNIVDLTSRFLQVLTMPWNLIDIQYQIIQQEKENNPGSRDSQSRSKVQRAVFKLKKDLNVD